MNRCLQLPILLSTILLATPARSASFDATIVWTRYGIPHVTAHDFAGLGYGQGYAYARDNLCLLADYIITVRGERSKYFGAGATTSVAFTEVENLDSDFFFKAEIDLSALRAGLARSSAAHREMVRGFVAGYNRLLRDTPPPSRPSTCRNAPWVTAISTDDLLRLTEAHMIELSGSQFLADLAKTKPPSSSPDKQIAGKAQTPASEYASSLGSNAWAFGKKVTQDGSVVLLGNPHFPWTTTNRLYEIQLTIPGEINAMGVMLGGTPGLVIGFNHDIAWSHTVSTDRRVTFFELALDPRESTSYIVDGKHLPMKSRTISVTTKEHAVPETRTFYTSIFGPIVSTASTPWTQTRAYAIRDADHSNTRAGDTWLAIARAKSVEEIRGLLAATEGIPFANTIAADRAGRVLYADIDAAPNLSAKKLELCAPRGSVEEPSAFEQEYKFTSSPPLIVLDGRRSACNWDIAEGTPVPGLMPASAMPFLIREDYVANSNDSYWLANPGAPLLGFSPILGPTREMGQLRTQMGALAIEERLNDTDGLGGKGVSRENVEAMLYANRNLAAELVLDDLVKLCRNLTEVTSSHKVAIDVRPGCGVLQAWDRKMNRDSRGALLFVEFWKRASKIKNLWRVPFDPDNPIHTPWGLDIAGGAASEIARAIADAVEVLREERLPIDISNGDALFALDGHEHIPLQGGDGEDGVLNALYASFVSGVGGYVPEEGSSYIQVVSFNASGPIADAVLTYGQSTDPESPHFSDQTRVYAGKGWVRLPFDPADVTAQATDSRLRLSE